MHKLILLLLCSLAVAACSDCPECPVQEAAATADYHSREGRDDILSGGVRMIEVSTPSGPFKVWTKRTGNHPTIKVLVVHGGPGGTHEYLEGIDSYFPEAGIEYYYYDQLGSYYSDQPDDTTLWTLDRFVEEVEQVRQALGLNSDNFYLLGQSWGGILGLEYALKYQEHLKGLVISNMMCSIPAYSRYAKEVLGPGLGSDIFEQLMAYEADGRYHEEAYLSLVHDHYYPKHVLRMPMEDWPEPVLRMFRHLNTDIYIRMQGPTEFGISESASLKDWDRSSDLPSVRIPVLTIGARYDTMDPEHMEWMAGQFPNGSYLYCPEGSHLALYDDPETYFSGLIDWIRKVDSGQ